MSNVERKNLIEAASIQAAATIIAAQMSGPAKPQGHLPHPSFQVAQLAKAIAKAYFETN